LQASCHPHLLSWHTLCYSKNRATMHILCHWQILCIFRAKNVCGIDIAGTNLPPLRFGMLFATRARVFYQYSAPSFFLFFFHFSLKVFHQHPIRSYRAGKMVLQPTRWRNTMYNINELGCDEIRLMTAQEFEAKIGGYEVGDEIEMIDAELKVLRKTKEIVQIAVWY
jgi:hypothetical protein